MLPIKHLRSLLRQCFPLVYSMKHSFLFFYFALQLIVMDLNLAGAQVTEIEYRCELMLYTTRFSQGIWARRERAVPGLEDCSHSYWNTLCACAKQLSVCQTTLLLAIPKQKPSPSTCTEKTRRLVYAGWSWFGAGLSCWTRRVVGRGSWLTSMVFWWLLVDQFG